MTPETMKRFDVTGAELAEHLGLSRSAISMKANGRRPWTVNEALQVLELIKKSHHDATLEDLFAAPLAEDGEPETAVAHG